MKVYVLLLESSYDNEPSEIVGVFETEQQAVEYKIPANLKNMGDGFSEDIKEVPFFQAPLKDLRENKMFWHRLFDKKPYAYEVGDWDGKRTDNLLVETDDGLFHIVKMYEGFMDGCFFCNFINGDGYEVEKINRWSNIVFSIL